MAKLKLIVFDWDGTLSDSADRIVRAVGRAAAQVGLPVLAAQQVRDIIGLGLMESFQTLYPDADVGLFEPFTTGYRDAYLSSEQATARLFDGAIETLGTLHSEFTLAVATGKSRVGLDREMVETETAHFFRTSRCADETEPKPHPQMLLEILEQTGIAPDETLMIGDTDHDIKMAHGAGVTPVAVNCGAQLPDRLSAANPAVILDSVSQMPAWIAENGLA